MQLELILKKTLELLVSIMMKIEILWELEISNSGTKHNLVLAAIHKQTYINGLVVFQVIKVAENFTEELRLKLMDTQLKQQSTELISGKVLIFVLQE